MRRLTLLLCVCALTAEARPYRAIVNRTAETTPGGHLELGASYQGFLFGVGHPGFPSVLHWHQVAAHARWGIIDGLELDLQAEALISYVPSPGVTAHAYFGDLPIGLQWTFLDRPKWALGIWGRVTIPTGPSRIDELPPTLSDGTWDGELTFLAEVRPNHGFRLLANVGFLYHHVRERGPDPDFDVPEAVKWGVSATFNLGNRWLFALEAVGHHFFRPDITPVWTNNQHLIEVIPGVRFEIIPRLVLEAGLGIAVTPQLRELYQVRPLLGLTYELGGK
ncbi:MAG: hypothetical protein IPJ65_21400 [Archangiaceae bacterium]|nr:hypothetical protein [Archangiaceae bacterium]